jgi:hypothetical protein
MAIYNSNVMNVFSKGGRIRTLNFRGSLLSSLATVTPYNTVGGAHLEVGDILPLFPIPYRCMIRGIYVASIGGVNANFRVSLNLYGLKKDGKTIDKLIKANVDGNFATLEMPTVATGLKLVTNSVFASNTLYQSLSGAPAASPWVPIQEFVPYKEDRYGILAFNVTTAADSGFTADSRISVRIDFIEAAPSSGPFINTIGLTADTV